MERKLYIVLEKKTISPHDGYFPHRVFKKKLQAKKFCKELNHQKLASNFKKLGVKKALEDIYFTYYGESEIIAELVKRLERTKIDLQNLSLEDFSKIQKILKSKDKVYSDYEDRLDFYIINQVVEYS